MIALAISLTGVIYFLLVLAVLAVLALLVVGVRYLLGLMGVVVPQPVWAIPGLILFLALLLWFLGGGGGVSIR